MAKSNAKKDLKASRDVGPGSTLHQSIIAQQANDRYMFGGRAIGPGDSGTHREGPLPGGARVIKSGENKGKVVKYYGAVGRIDNEPDFKNVDPNAITLAQMQVNAERETLSDQRDHGAPSKSGASGGTKLQDMGFREVTPLRYQNAPVRTWIDESIKIKKD
jgi:hypothetical protein